MRLIRQLHLYTGLILSLALFLIAISGAVLIYKHEYWQLQYEPLRGPDITPSPDEQAGAIREAWGRFGQDLETLKMPEDGVPAYRAYLRDHHEALLHPDDFGIIDQWQLRERAMGLLFDIHVHLMAGDAGEKVAGVIGLIGCLMAITGLILWWPTRRVFSWRNLWPRDMSRRSLLAWHRDAGTVLSPLLLLFLLTGSAMVFYTQARTLLNAAFGDPVPQIELPERPAIALDPADTVPMPEASTIARVRDHFPDAKLTFFYADTTARGLHRFRLRRGCELHPNGLTFIYTDARNGEILQVADPCAMPSGERLTHLIYPLHSAKTGSELYRLLALLTALALAASALTGCVTYAQKLSRTGQARRRAGAASS